MLRSISGEDGLILRAQTALRFVKVRLRKRTIFQHLAANCHHSLVPQLTLKAFRLHQITFEYFPDTQPTCPLMTMAFQPLWAVAMWSKVMPALTVVMAR